MTKLLSISAILSLGLGFAFAQEDDDDRREHRDEQHKPEMRKEAFLGIATGPVHESLRAQLGIDDGVGLIVHHVHEESPAAEKLQAHDIIIKLDDQILINPDQLAVLVRNAGSGTKVNITLMRRGAEQTTIVELAEREVPEHRPIFEWHGDGEMLQRGIHEAWERVQQEMREARERIDQERRRAEEFRERERARPPRGEAEEPRRPAPEGRPRGERGEPGERGDRPEPVERDEVL